MRGKTYIRILIVVAIFVIGWTCGQVLKDVSPFILDWSISLSDVLGIIVEICLAIFIALLVEKGLQNQRVEKDFFISELDDAQTAYSELAKICSRMNPLSFNQTVYQVEKSKRDLINIWETMKVRNKAFHDDKQKEFDALINLIKNLNSQLSDSAYFKPENDFKPVNITKNLIHLNNTVIKEIDNSFDKIKESIFKLKIAINDM